MDLYQLTFAVLVITSCYLAWTHHRHELKAPPSKEASLGGVLESHGDPKRFRRIFMLVYLLVMGSDWLQVLLFQLQVHALKWLTIPNREHMFTHSTKMKRTFLRLSSPVCSPPGSLPPLSLPSSWAPWPTNMADDSHVLPSASPTRWDV